MFTPQGCRERCLGKSKRTTDIAVSFTSTLQGNKISLTSYVLNHRYLIKTVKEAVGYVSLGFREGVGIGYVHLGILVFIAVNLDTTT